MKSKTIVFLLLHFCFIITAYSQVRYGLKTGIQASESADIHFESKMRIPGLNAGAFASIPLQKKNNFANTDLFLNIELLYSQEGESEGELIGEWYEQSKFIGNIDYNQDYINLPVLLRMHITNHHNIFFETGPQFGYLIYEKNKELDEKFYGKNNSFNLSVVLGGGFCFGKNCQYEISGRICWGALDLYPDWIKRNFTATVGLGFGYIFRSK